MLRIRLARRGTHKRPSYRIVVIPAASSREGRTVDDLGYYNPLANPSDIKVDVERGRDWIRKGAQPSDRVWKLFEIAQPGFRAGLQTAARTAPEAARVASPQAATGSEPKTSRSTRAPSARSSTAKASASSKSKSKAPTTKATRTPKSKS